MKIVTKVVRYFAVPRAVWSFVQDFEIVIGSRQVKITLGNFNNRPELNIRKYVPTEYKDAMGAELTEVNSQKIP